MKVVKKRHVLLFLLLYPKLPFLFFRQDIVNVSSAISVSRGSHGHCQGYYIIPVLKKQEDTENTAARVVAFLQ